LLPTRRCPDSGIACEMPRRAETVFSTVCDMINTLLFAQADLNSMEHSDYSPLVAVIFIIFVCLPCPLSCSIWSSP
jgi:hypothetical protein